MTAWQPTSGPQAARNRAALLRRVRDYFDAAGVLEVDTPALSPYAVTDPQIESLEIRASLISEQPLFLHTSPEFCMKRLLASGYPDIFSICRVFRDAEAGRRHQPEFTMIEWYRLGFGLVEIVNDTLELINATLDSAVSSAAPDCYDYRESFLEFAGTDPFDASVSKLADAARADAALRDAVGNERDDWLDLLLSTVVAPAFATDRLTVLQHFPASQAALARLCPDDPRVADRFEVFLGALELANGYVELTDAGEQSNRMQIDQQDRHRRGRCVRPHDEALLAALEFGLPLCAGVAMGFERLQMIDDSADDIRDVICFSFETDR